MDMYPVQNHNWYHVYTLDKKTGKTELIRQETLNFMTSN